jgi:large conductance mechanosensitive channel
VWSQATTLFSGGLATQRGGILKTINEFKAFILRGNVVDLAIAVVIGAAFGGIVTAFVKDLITPLIAAIGGKPDFSALYFTINHSKFMIGDFINSIVGFLIIATVIFFLIIRPMNMLMGLRKKSADHAELANRECPYCLSSIPAKATRCAYCTSEIPALVAVKA